MGEIIVTPFPSSGDPTSIGNITVMIQTKQPHRDPVAAFGQRGLWTMTGIGISLVDDVAPAHSLLAIFSARLSWSCAVMRSTAGRVR
jgi:hypothetical protein